MEFAVKKLTKERSALKQEVERLESHLQFISNDPDAKKVVKNVKGVLAKRREEVSSCNQALELLTTV